MQQNQSQQGSPTVLLHKHRHDQSGHSSMGGGFRNDMEKMRGKRSLEAQWGMVSEQFQSRTCSEAGALKLDFVFSSSPRNWFSHVKVSTTSNECPCKTLSMETACDHLTLDWGWSPGKSEPVKGIIWFAAEFPSPRSQVLQPEIKIKRAVSTLLQAAYQQRGDIPETHYIQYTWEMWK